MNNVEDMKNCIEYNYKYLTDLVNSQSEAEKKDKESYLLKAMADIHGFMLECNQELFEYDKPTRVKKLIRVNRVIPTKQLDYLGARYVLVSGLYIVADMWILPKSIYDEWITSNSRKGNGYRTLESYGLPQGSQLNGSTARPISMSSVGVLTKGFLNDIIDKASSWEYVIPSYDF